jgi:hypothetical protein
MLTTRPMLAHESIHEKLARLFPVIFSILDLLGELP